ncbi:methylated-DNA--protein-cysteine methyltransferase [Campylobacterota bacterium]|nr:methylated-DNA--protein-cysteine methyltransferase [Campylobacterota bacterium]
MYYTTHHNSPLGLLMLASDGENIVGAWLEGQKYFAATLGDQAVQKEDLPVFAQAENWLKRYFDGAKPAIAELPLAPRGGEFRAEVWKILCEIGYGECTTYGSIAKTLADRTGKGAAAQAVGGAVGHNPISIIIPCHRVVGANGNLTGYAGGIDAKIKLLRHEGVDMSRLFVPTAGTAL